MVETSQTVYLKGKEEDPVAMWEALKSVHLQQKPGARYNAYDDLFSIRKQEEESLQSLANRVDVVNGKGLHTLEGMGQGYVRVRVRV